LHITEISTKTEGYGVANLLDNLFSDTFWGGDAKGTIKVNGSPRKKFHYFSLPDGIQ
jgi:hypothetical protein